MKFGKLLQEEMIPEWESQYLNYKILKSLIKKTEEKIVSTLVNSDVITNDSQQEKIINNFNDSKLEYNGKKKFF